jgi:hypothetical protein
LLTLLLVPVIQVLLFLAPFTFTSTATAVKSDIPRLHNISAYYPLSVPFAVTSQGTVSAADLSDLVRTMTGTHVHFSQYQNVSVLERDTLRLGKH